MLSSTDESLFKFSAIKGNDIFQTKSLKFNSGIKVFADNFICQEISDCFFELRMNPTVLNNIID